MIEVITMNERIPRGAQNLLRHSPENIMEFDCCRLCLGTIGACV